MKIYNKETKSAAVATALKKTCLIKQCSAALLRHCHIFNFILSVSWNNENKLKITLQFNLVKGIKSTLN